MLTQCPSCETIYQISANELGAAKGFVECGECGIQFNALDKIADEPQFKSNSPQLEPVSTEEHKHAPTFVLMEDSAATDPTNDPEQSVEDAELPPAANSYLQPLETNVDSANLTNQEITPTDELDKTLELAILQDDQPLDEIKKSPLAPDTSNEGFEPVAARPESSQISSNDKDRSSPSELPPEEHQILFNDPELPEPPEPQEVSESEKIISETEFDLDEVPPILQQELMAMREPKKSGAGIFWGAAAIVLLGGILLQAAWHYKGALFERYPNIRPYAQHACVVMACELNDEQPLEPIQLVSRDVRTHPRYENSLLVNASMINSGDETIAFPTVQLGLFDPTGTAIGIRQFSPPEYLDKSIDIDAGIPSGRSVHVVLELAKTGDTASSFEFSFH